MGLEDASTAIYDDGLTRIFIVHSYENHFIAPFERVVIAPPFACCIDQ